MAPVLCGTTEGKSNIGSGLDTLENKMKRLAGFFGVGSVTINTLGNNKWELKRPVSASIEQREAEDFVACLYDIDLYGYGDTIPEALDDLKMAMVNQFEYLVEQESEVQLANSLQKQLQFLRNILVESEDA